MINKKKEVVSHKYQYMLLSRYQSDVKYFLGYGNRREKNLYFGNTKEHIMEMIKLWKILPVKPVWLRASELIAYKKRLL